VSTPKRRRFDDDDDQPADEPNWSTYHHPDTVRGPSPAPSWVITSPSAADDDLGVLKTGKEAEVSLIRRSHGHESVWLAAKRFRDPQHRLFHRDAGYLEGRRVRRSRETRAMASRSAFGRELIAGQWAAVEFAVLGQLWRAGAAVPYPVQLLGTELLIEFIGDADGVAAPRLAQLHLDVHEAADLYRQLRHALVLLGEAGYTHGDLSPYNILVHDGRLVLIDLPQAVDLVGNQQGFEFLRRDCRNVCEWFDACGVFADPGELEAEVRSTVPGVRR
jgi:RIO kinase 1